jgi:hypothetical protein
MANEIAKATQNFFEKYGEAATQRNINGRLLRFNKFGEYVAGKDGEKIPHGTRLAAHMPSLAVGFIRWEDGNPVQFVLGLISEGYLPPRRDELGYTDQSKWDVDDDGEPRDPWQFSNELVLIDLESDELFTFSTSSKGSLGAIGELCKSHGKHLRMKPDEVPIVELDVGSYQHPNRNYGEIRFPIFKVVEWVSTDKLPAIDGTSSPDADGGEEPTLALPEPASAQAAKAVLKAAKRHKI